MQFLAYALNLWFIINIIDLRQVLAARALA